VSAALYTLTASSTFRNGSAKRLDPVKTFLMTLSIVRIEQFLGYTVEGTSDALDCDSQILENSRAQVEGGIADIG
jgi:hypothetical protein